MTELFWRNLIWRNFLAESNLAESNLADSNLAESNLAESNLAECFGRISWRNCLADLSAHFFGAKPNIPKLMDRGEHVLENRLVETVR